jgi:hypothetical protein
MTVKVEDVVEVLRGLYAQGKKVEEAKDKGKGKGKERTVSEGNVDMEDAE